MKTDVSRLNILLIQNRQGTLSAVEQALESNNVRCQLLMVRVGPATLSYLRRKGPYAKVPAPDLVLFDLTDSDPKSIKILKAIKADKSCKSLSIVLLTREDCEEEVVKLTSKRSRESGFAPIELDGFTKAMKSFKTERFMHAVRLLEAFGYLLIRMPEIEDDLSLQQTRKMTLQTGT